MNFLLVWVVMIEEGLNSQVGQKTGLYRSFKINIILFFPTSLEGIETSHSIIHDDLL